MNIFSNKSKNLSLWFILFLSGLSGQLIASDDERSGAVCGVAKELSSPSPVRMAEDVTSQVIMAPVVASTTTTTTTTGATGISGESKKVFTDSQMMHETLVLAVKHNDLAGINFALKNGANVNALAGDSGHLWCNQSCLMIAVRFKLLDVVKYLLNVPGIDVNQPDSITGTTALMYAVISPHTTEVSQPFGENWRVDRSSATEIIKCLLDQPSIKINQKNKIGCTALDYAVLSDDRDDKLEAVNLLLEKGADPVNGLSKQVRDELCLYLEGQATQTCGLSKVSQSILAARTRALADLEHKLKMAADYALYLESAWNKTKRAFDGGSKALVLY